MTGLLPVTTTEEVNMQQEQRAGFTGAAFVLIVGLMFLLLAWGLSR